VTKRNIHTGHYLQPNASGGPSVLFVVARIDKLRIQADIPEAEAAYITEGLPGKIRVPVLREQTFEGKVARTSGTLDAKSRTLRVEMDYPNQDGKLRPGLYANVIFTVELADRFTLPASAIFTSADLPCCYRVENGKAVRTPLKLGMRDGPLVEVLKKQAREATWEPITGQEEIILTNLGTISDGKDVPAGRMQEK
jgi:multidrug efflux pump subunit AcrA (membrane-fusion protein)